MKKYFFGLFLLLLIAGISAEPIYFIYAPGCPHCENLAEHLYQTFTIENPEYEIIPLNISEQYNTVYDLQKEKGIPFEYWGYTPKLIYTTAYCIGDSPCVDFLEQIKNGELTPDTPPEKEQDLTIFKMAALAGVDAVNPCAIAVLIILLSMALTKYEGKKGKILLMGLAFTMAIFFAYLAIGLLIIAGYKAATSAIAIQMDFLRTIIAILAILIGLFNLKDYFNYGGLGFVMEVPRSWRPKMKEIIQNANTPIAAFIAGIIVSLFLLPCTSGPYFVASAILAELSFMQALPWLIFYNFIFILPMLGITLAVYFGLAEVDKLKKWRTTNIKNLHLFAALILILFGILMLLGIF